MFSRLRKWLRGKKRHVSLNSKRYDNNNESLRKAKSLHDMVTLREDEDDGFKKNNVDDFDIVLSADIHRRNDTLRGASSVSPGANTESRTIPSDGGNTNNIQDEIDGSIPREQFDQATIVDDSPEGSVVDLVTPVPTRNESPSHEKNLSFDEMQVLSMFDSIVNDIDTEEKDLPTEASSISKNSMDLIRDDIPSSLQQEEPIMSAKLNVESRAKSSINFDAVIGDSSSETSQIEHVNNWRVSGVEPLRKSFRFVENNSMYLPLRPELPPADYPDTDDELQQDSVREIGISDDLSGSSPPTLQNSSSNTAVQTIQHANSNVKTMQSPQSDPRVNEDNVPNDGIHSSNIVDRNSSNVSRNSQFSETTSTIANGKVQSSAIPHVPKRPKPRVTSFKASTGAPKIKNSQNFTELVEQFERF